MKRIFLLFLLLVAACSPSGTAELAVESTEEQESNPPPTANSQTSVESSDADDSATKSDSQDVPVLQIAQTPAEAGQFRQGDHAKGADDPLITIVEYGDFQ